MNILLSSSKFLPYKGGIENSVNALAIQFSEKGHEVTLITSDLQPNINITTYIESNLFKIIRYKKPHLRGYFQTTSLIIQMIRNWKSNDQKYDLIICRDIESALPLFLKHRKSRLIYIAPGCIYHQNLNRLKEQFKKKSIRKIIYAYNRYWYLPICWVMQQLVISLSDKVVAWSNNTLLELGKKNDLESSKYVQINPGVDLNRFKYIEADYTKAQEMRLLMLCRLDPLKNIEDAIKALKICKFPVKLEVYGDGKQEMERLKTLSKSLCIIDKVDFKGEAEEPEKSYPSSDYFLMLSIYEPFGQTIIESMACGTPVIAYNNNKTAVNEIILNEVDGYIITPTIESLAEKLNQLYKTTSHEKEKTRKLAREKIERLYRWEVTSSNIIDLANKK